MDISWPNTVAESWGEVVSLLLGVGTAVYGLFLFRNSNKIRRTDLLKALLDEYNGKPVTDSIKEIEEGHITFSRTFAVPGPVKRSVCLADPALLFFSNVCYLRQSGLVSSREFSFFRWKIEDILRNEAVYDYVVTCVENDKFSPYKRLLQYRRTAATRKEQSGYESGSASSENIPGND